MQKAMRMKMLQPSVLMMMLLALMMMMMMMMMMMSFPQQRPDLMLKPAQMLSLIQTTVMTQMSWQMVLQRPWQTKMKQKQRLVDLVQVRSHWPGCDIFCPASHHVRSSSQPVQAMLIYQLALP